MIIVMCRLLEERQNVLRVLESINAVWGSDPRIARGTAVNAIRDITNVNANGRIYYMIDDEKNPIIVTRRDVAPIKGTPYMYADDFVEIHTAKTVAPKTEDRFVASYPFELVGEPVELEKGSNKWYRQISTAKDMIINGHVEAKWRGANTTFPLMAILSKRPSPYIGYPHGATPGPLFVRVPAPEKVVKMTKAELQKLVAEKFGANAVLQIAE